MGLNRNIYVDIWGLEGTGRKKLWSKKLLKNFTKNFDRN